MKAVAWYTAAIVALVAALGWVMALLFPGADDQKAIWISGGVVAVVQVLSFLAIRFVDQSQVMLARGVGSLVRLVSIGVFAVVVAKVIHLPLAPALISMAAFFFVSTVVEPLVLRL